MKRANSKQRAFTIVELIIVIAVIGVLAAILIPAFSNMIARANAKSALSDARNTLTAFLADNLELVDGEIAKSIVIFVEKAKMHYVYGYQTQGPDMGKLMQSAGNPFKYEDLSELITQYNCTDLTLAQSADPADTEDFAFYLYPAGSPSGTKSMDEINNNFINLTDRIEGLPATTQVFDGFLIGMFIDATANPPGNGTNPGDKPGGGGSAGGDPGGDPGTTEYTVTYDKGIVATAENMPENTTTVNGTHTVTTLIPTSEGYTFSGWFLGSEEITGGSLIQDITSDITITASWELIPVTTYTVTFHDNGPGPESGMGSVTNMPPNASYPAGTEVEFPAFPTFPIPGYICPGWTIGTENDSNHNGTKYQPGDTFIITGDTHIWAHWEQEQQASGVMFSSGDVTNPDGGMPDDDPTASGSYTIPADKIPRFINGAEVALGKNTAYSFTSWKRSDNNELCYPGDTITFTGAITLTAQWETGFFAIHNVEDWIKTGDTTYHYPGDLPNGNYFYEQNYVLAADIDFGTTLRDDYAKLGGRNTFNKTLNGNGFTISNFNMDWYNTPYGPDNASLLYGSGTYTKIHNLKIDNCKFRTYYHPGGGGYSAGYSGGSHAGVVTAYNTQGEYRNVVVTNCIVGANTTDPIMFYATKAPGSWAPKFYNCTVDGDTVS